MDSILLAALLLATAALVGLATLAIFFTLQKESPKLDKPELTTTTISPSAGTDSVTVAGVVFDKGPTLHARSLLKTLSASLTPSRLLYTDPEGVMASTQLDSWFKVPDPHLVLDVDADTTQLSLSVDTQRVKETILAGKNTALNPVVLNEAGKVDSSLFPLVALTSVNVVVDNTALLAHADGTQEGDVAIVSGTNKTYLRNAAVYNPASTTIADFWIEVADPRVHSVNGSSGIVTLNRFSTTLGDTQANDHLLEVAVGANTTLGINGNNTTNISELLHNIKLDAGGAATSKHGGPGVRVTLQGGPSANSAFTVTTYGDNPALASEGTLNASPAFMIDNQGNVGMGTTPSAERLLVGGAMRVTGAVTTSNNLGVTGTSHLNSKVSIGTEAPDTNTYLKIKGATDVAGTTLEGVLLASTVRATGSSGNYSSVVIAPELVTASPAESVVDTLYGLEIRQINRGTGDPIVTSAYGLHVTAPNTGGTVAAAKFVGDVEVSSGVFKAADAEMSAVTLAKAVGQTLDPNAHLQVYGVLNVSSGTVQGTIFQSTARAQATTGTYSSMVIAPLPIEGDGAGKTLAEVRALEISSFTCDGVNPPGVGKAYGLVVNAPSVPGPGINVAGRFVGDIEVTGVGSFGTAVVGSGAAETDVELTVHGDTKITGTSHLTSNVSIGTEVPAANTYLQIKGATDVAGTTLEGVLLASTVRATGTGGAYSSVVIAPEDVKTDTTGRTLDTLYGLEIRQINKAVGDHAVTSAYGLHVTAPNTGGTAMAAKFVGDVEVSSTATLGGARVGTSTTTKRHLFEISQGNGTTLSFDGTNNMNTDILHNMYHDGQNWVSRDGGPGTRMIMSGGSNSVSKWQLETYSAITGTAAAADLGSPSGYLELNSVGNFGVGVVPSNSYKLEVSGMAKVVDGLHIGGNAATIASAAASSTMSIFGGSSGDGAHIELYGSNNANSSLSSCAFLDCDNFYVRPKSGASNRFVVDDSGNVGIPTADASYKLRVEGKMFSTQSVIHPNAGDAINVLENTYTNDAPRGLVLSMRSNGRLIDCYHYDTGSTAFIQRFGVTADGDTLQTGYALQQSAIMGGRAIQGQSTKTMSTSLIPFLFTADFVSATGVTYETDGVYDRIVILTAGVYHVMFSITGRCYSDTPLTFAEFYLRKTHITNPDVQLGVCALSGEQAGGPACIATASIQCTVPLAVGERIEVKYQCFNVGTNPQLELQCLLQVVNV